MHYQKLILGRGKKLINTVRDWINCHPFKNSPESRLICNLHNGASVRPEVLWTIMKQLRQRIIRLLENDSIKDPRE
jgi:integrase/recombinase XerD